MKSQSEYPVFNGGARVCLGKKMAESISVMVIAKLVLFFDFEDCEGGYRFSRNSLTLPMKGGLPVWARARRRAADM
jgi:cytochrome P450